MKKIAIIGGGNIGCSLAKGLVKSGKYNAEDITITRRNIRHIEPMKEEGFLVTNDNDLAIRENEIIILAILPQQLNEFFKAHKTAFDPDRHLLISVISGVEIKDFENILGPVNVIRAMPNTAISLGESMTCIAVNDRSREQLLYAQDIFNTVGTTIEINEELMTSATALCACGIAFFLRAIRAASQGGIEIGFHADEALKMAAQTAKGAASLLLEHEKHPEREIDKVTSPEGCTIAGLNEMEHQGFSSAMIKGITVSAKKAGGLYSSGE